MLVYGSNIDWRSFVKLFIINVENIRGYTRYQNDRMEGGGGGDKYFFTILGGRYTVHIY